MSVRAMKKTKLSQSMLTLISISSGSILYTSVFASVHAYANDTDVQQLDTIVVAATQQTADYTAPPVNVSGFASRDIRKIPASISSVSADLMADQQAKVLADVIKNDAAVGENYAPIGYYPNVVSRGFVLDKTSSYFINSQLIRGEQNVALENKQQVEILKGVSAIQGGMATSGGVVNYVTKRPQDVRRLSFSVDEYGDNSVAMDVGGFWGQQKQFGYRINMAHQNLSPYVEHADGDRQFASLALDWQINDQSKVLFDIEAQKQKQRSVAGYQLLDGKVLSNLKWDRLLGYQNDSRAVSNKSLNSSLQYQYQFNEDWSGSLSAAHSKVVIDDNSSFAWGCFSDICKSSGSSYGFDKNGNYDIYNFQIPDDTYQTNQFKAALEGVFSTGALQHHIQLDVAHTQKKQDAYKGVNQLIATGNIYSNITTPQNNPDAGLAKGEFDSKQSSITALDRIQFNSQWSTLLGGKWIDLNEKAYNPDSSLQRKTNLNKFLPQVAVMFNPWENTHLYASYTEGLIDGATAPWYAKNASQVMSSMNSRQYEIGLKQQIQDFLFTAAVFDIKQDNQSVQMQKDGLLYLMAEGQQQNYGLELSLSGPITDALKISSSLAYTQAELVDISDAAFKGHQMQNVPKLRFASFAAYDIAAIEGLSVLGGVRYNSSKFANREATAKVSGYTVVDLGAVYQFKLNGHDTALRFNVDNVFNKKYWRDVGGYIGDDYLFLGAPRTAKLAVNVSF